MKRHWTAVVEDITGAASLIELALIESDEGELSPKPLAAITAKAKALMVEATETEIAEALASSGAPVLGEVLRGGSSHSPAPGDAAPSIFDRPDLPTVDDHVGVTETSEPLPPEKVVAVRSPRIVGRLVRSRGSDGQTTVMGLSSLRGK